VLAPSAKTRGPTPELRQAADELAGRVASGSPVTDADLRRIRQLVALDLIRSNRPTSRAKGLQLLEDEAAYQRTQDEEHNEVGPYETVVREEDAGAPKGDETPF